jgi:predicted RNA-binding Zn-ribbon protein involved in translation (DUF1610 family)
MNKEINDIKIEINSEVENKIKKRRCTNCLFTVEYKHKSKPKECPKCGDVFWDRPEDEYKLSLLQIEYLKTRDNLILGQMYEIFKKYAKKIIIKMVKGKYFFRVDDLEMKAHDSANKMIEYYLEKPDFRIENSFGGYLSWPIRNVLYGDKKNDNHDSLNCMIDEENELGDYIPSLSEEVRRKTTIDFEYDYLSKNSSISQELLKIVIKINDKIKKNHGRACALKTLIGIKNKLKKCTAVFMDDYYSYVGIDVQNHINNSLFFIYKYLKMNLM